MGRFFQTDKPTFLDDKMLKLPWELMGAALAKTDERYEKNNSILDAVAAINPKSFGKEDEARVKELLAGISGDIEGLTKTMAEDPLAFANQSTKLRQLQRSITENMTTGELGSIGNKATEWEAFTKKNDEAVLKKLITQAQQTNAENFYRGNWKGTDFNGANNKLVTEGIKDYVDTEALATQYGTGFIPDEFIRRSWNSTDGRYITKDIRTDTEVKPEDVKKTVKGALLDDDKWNDYIDQQITHGVISGTKEEIADVAAERAAEKFGHKKEEHDRDIKADPNYLNGGTSPNKDVPELFESGTGKVSNTSGGNYTKHIELGKKYEDKINKVSNTLTALIDKFIPNLDTKEFNVIKNNILNGTKEVIAKIAEDTGMDKSELNSIYNQNLEAQTYLRQNQSIREEFKNSEEFRNIEFYGTDDKNNQFRQQSLEKFKGKDYIKDEPYNDAYKAWSLKRPGSPKGIGDENITTLDYTLVGLGIPKEQVPDLERKVITNINGAFVNITSNTGLASKIRELKLDPSRIQIQKLIDVGLLEKEVVSKMETKKGEEIFAGTQIVNQNFQWTEKAGGVANFNIEKGSLGVGTGFNDKGGIDFLLKATGEGAEQYTILYPTSEVGDYSINRAIDKNYKILKLKEWLARGANGSSYNLVEGINVVADINGSQSIEIADKNKSGGVRKIMFSDEPQMRAIAESLIR